MSSGFEVDGRSYCGNLSLIYDWFAHDRDGDSFELWRPVVELYRKWSSRLWCQA